ncbi:MAG: DegQ family serine endoprotease [Rhodospirillales bacterium]|nr:DegQ family serine endoprotease [Rhodospirillales bacterium]
MCNFARILVVAGLTLGQFLSAGGVLAAEKSPPASMHEIQLSFAPLVKKTAPAVVNIYTRTIVRTRARMPLFDDPFFRQFFGNQFGFDRDAPEIKRQQNALGSGVIVAKDGVIVTNNHVIEGADEIRVVLHDRREFDAKLVATDEKTDLAILKIETDGKPLPVIDLADSDDLEVGDLVLAIGNPFGVGQTVTSGIVSALSRSGVGLSTLGSFIQTDAAINPGNSGGALIGLDGRLVGINTAIFSKSGGSQGIGFAVPSNMVRAVIRGVSEAGRLVRPWLGAAGQTVNQDIANSLGLDRPTGVLINAVHAQGAANKAGVHVGDVILAVNGHDAFDGNALAHRIATLPVGDEAVLRIWRRGRTKALKLVLMPPPEIPKRDIRDLGGEQPLRGARVANMSPAVADELDLDPFLDGVFIMAIEPGTPADRLGFRPGDFVRAVNGQPAATVGKLVDLLKDPVERWRITVERGGTQRDLVINR